MVERVPLHLLPVRDPGPYDGDRRCREAACITRLHRNNPGPFCEYHRLELLRDRGEDAPDYPGPPIDPPAA